MSILSGFKVLIGGVLVSSPPDKAQVTANKDPPVYARVAAIARIRSAVSSSAGKNVSSASSESVMSTGVPKIIVADMKLRISPSNLSLNGIATLSAGNGADRAGIG